MCVFYQLLMAIHIHTTNQLRGSTKGAFTLISQIHHAFLLLNYIQMLITRMNHLKYYFEKII